MQEDKKLIQKEEESEICNTKKKNKKLRNG